MRPLHQRLCTDSQIYVQGDEPTTQLAHNLLVQVVGRSAPPENTDVGLKSRFTNVQSHAETSSPDSSEDQPSALQPTPPTQRRKQGEQSAPRKRQPRAHLIQEQMPEGARAALLKMSTELDECTWADFQVYSTINEHQRTACLGKYMSALMQSFMVRRERRDAHTPSLLTLRQILCPAAKYTVVHFTQSQWIVPAGEDILIPLSIFGSTAPKLSKQPLHVHRAIYISASVYLELYKSSRAGVTFLWLHPQRGATPLRPTLETY